MVFDFNKVGRGELIAGGGGIALIVFMLVAHWYGLRETGLLPDPITAPGGVVEGFPRNAFESFTFLDVYLLVTALAAIALPLVRASELTVPPTIPINLIVAALGVVAVILIVIRLIDPPDLAISLPDSPTFKVSEIEGSGVTAEVTRKIGPWLGLAAAVGMTAGGLIPRRRT